MIHAMAQNGVGVLCGADVDTDPDHHVVMVATEVDCDGCRAALVELGALPS